MRFTASCDIDGARVVELERRVDDRGYFARMWCETELADHVEAPRISAINVGFSPAVGTLRGMHFQTAPHDEVKYVRCTRGAAFDVMVDLRPESPTHLRWFGAELTAGGDTMLLVPAGCAHGYLTLAPDTELMYLTDKPYAASAAGGIRYDDPAIGIEWPAPIVVVSDADRNWPLLVPTDDTSHGTDKEASNDHC